MVQEVGRAQRDDDGHIGQKTIGQEQLTEPAGVAAGETDLEEQAGVGQRDGGYLTAGQLDEGAAEEVTHANAEGGHSKAGHVLVGP